MTKQFIGFLPTQNEKKIEETSEIVWIIKLF
jgi:hypothetical protein